MISKILFPPYRAALIVVVGLAALAVAQEPIRLSFMSPTDKEIYQVLHSRNSIDQTNDALRVGRKLLNLPSTADLYTVTKLMQERLKTAHAKKLDAVSEAHFVLQTNEKLSDETLRNRLLLISQIMFYFDLRDPRGCSHRAGDSGPQFKLLQAT